MRQVLCARTNPWRHSSLVDRYGHDAGNLVLRKFAEVLRANTRASNICARIRGEEFVLILTHTNKEDAFAAVDRLRRCIERECFTFRGEAVSVTAGFGIAGIDDELHCVLGELLY